MSADLFDAVRPEVPDAKQNLCAKPMKTSPIALSRNPLGGLSVGTNSYLPTYLLHGTRSRCPYFPASSRYPPAVVPPVLLLLLLPNRCFAYGAVRSFSPRRVPLSTARGCWVAGWLASTCTGAGSIASEAMFWPAVHPFKSISTLILSWLIRTACVPTVGESHPCRPVRVAAHALRLGCAGA